MCSGNVYKFIWDFKSGIAEKTVDRISEMTSGSVMKIEGASLRNTSKNCIFWGDFDWLKKNFRNFTIWKKEIKEQQRWLKELKTLATSCIAKITGFPNGNGVSDKIANYATKIADLKSLLDLNLKKCFYELNHINRFISSAQDSKMRMILMLRYIQNLSW